MKTFEEARTMNRVLSEAQSEDEVRISFTFTGNYHSIAPRAMSIQHFYGNGYMQSAMGNQDANDILQMSRDEKRLCIVLGQASETKACVSLLHHCEDVSDVACVAVGLVKRQVVPESVVRKSEFVARLIPFCPDIPHLNESNLNAHINRLLRQEAVPLPDNP